MNKKNLKRIGIIAIVIVVIVKRVLPVHNAPQKIQNKGPATFPPENFNQNDSWDPGIIPCCCTDWLIKKATALSWSSMISVLPTKPTKCCNRRTAVCNYKRRNTKIFKKDVTFYDRKRTNIMRYFIKKRSVVFYMLVPLPPVPSSPFCLLFE